MAAELYKKGCDGEDACGCEQLAYLTKPKKKP